MSDADTSADAIECMARFYEDEGKHMEVANAVGDATTAEYAAMCRTTAATLRALLARVEAAEAARTEAIRQMASMARQAGSWQGIAEGKDAIIRELETDLQRAEAERDAARALLTRALTHAERVAVLLNDITAEMHRLDEEEPKDSTRFDAMSLLLVRRFTDCSALSLMFDAEAAGVDVRALAQEPQRDA
jgi:chromosome segregation ATPase